MIRQREKAVYFSFSAMQMAFAVLLFWVCYLANDLTRISWLEAPVAYLQIAAVMLVTLVVEATTRRDEHRLFAGRLGHKDAIRLARRQALWVAAGFGIYLTLSRDSSISRLFLVAVSAACFTLFYATHRHGRRWLSVLPPSLTGKRGRLRVLVAGPPDWCASIRRRFDSHAEHLEFQPALHISASEPPDAIAEGVARRMPDVLVFPVRELPPVVVKQLLALADRRGFRCWLPVDFLPHLRERSFELQEAGGLSFLTPPLPPLAAASSRAVKRIFDIAASIAIILPVVIPLTAVVWLIQRFNSPGPVFYRQDRVGRDGRIFGILKFRSMHTGNADEARQAAAGDPRIYRGGHWLRRFSVDEFPQFINVLRGEMSVVGPRPHMIEHEHRFEHFHELYGSRRFVKPGVTGLAQVAGFRGEVKNAKDVRGRARYDLFYINHWSMGLDLRLVLWTLTVLAKPPAKAY